MSIVEFRLRRPPRLPARLDILTRPSTRHWTSCTPCTARYDTMQARLARVIPSGAFPIRTAPAISATTLAEASPISGGSTVSNRTRHGRAVAPKTHAYGDRCTVQRGDGTFCDAPSMPELPASICPKHAARIFMHLRDFVGKADRSDLAMRLISASEQRSRDTYAAAPIREVMAEVVYYVRVGDHVKIGYTTNLRNRMQAYPTGRLLATEPGGLTLERQRHEQFAHALDVGREWFTITPDLMGHIKALAAPTPAM